jgi:hypothetical protein
MEFGLRDLGITGLFSGVMVLERVRLVLGVPITPY